jgi:S1-C subfamily serine protease
LKGPPPHAKHAGRVEKVLWRQCAAGAGSALKVGLRGIIDAAKGYVLTNNHVISQAQKISVQLNDGREFDAKLVGSDDQSDIALLQYTNPAII